MPGLTKTLNFNYENLGREGYLVFTFDAETIAGHQMFTDYFPVVWRVVQLKETGMRRFPITFNQKFLFSTCHTRDGVAVVDQVITRINFKESTKLEGDDKRGYHWSVPEQISIEKNILQANNATVKAQGISLCCEDPSSSHVVPEPLLYIPSFRSFSALDVKFTGRLRIYHVPYIGVRKDLLMPNYVETVKISAPNIWEHTLDEPGLVDEWIITYNKVTGNYEIKAAE